MAAFNVDSFTSINIPLPPCCIEFWPLRSEYAVVGTYSYEAPLSPNETQTSSVPIDSGDAQAGERFGSLELIRVSGNNITLAGSFREGRLRKLPAILDLHFYPPHLEQPTYLAAASSVGSIDIFSIVDLDRSEATHGLDDLPHQQDIEIGFKQLHSWQVSSPTTLVTSFAWHPTRPHVLFTLDTGEVGVWDVPSERLLYSFDANKHTEIAWTAAWDLAGVSILSGGDDCTLRYHGQSDLSWCDRRIHSMGVTAILPLQDGNKDNLFITGSYDEHIRLIQAPQSGRRTELAELILGGGVWRLQKLPTDTRDAQALGEDGVALILASCMHGGVRVVKLARNTDEEWRFEVLANFEAHASMNYATDCQPRDQSTVVRSFISTSFYDKLICKWQF
ncbi:WD40 repeat-like protein [Polyplosphaeria fusca]|uniref:methylated diphthine methylhydrolase n=1 Tax=Polyplosphaeria fusca TaxID=682080 RepID=A0A9P4V2F3_9PLEO|nr:WD40 repeat-like protein [Polyplosphaeria fusca]